MICYNVRKGAMVPEVEVIAMKGLFQSPKIKQLFNIYQLVLIVIMFFVGISLIKEAQKSILSSTLMYTQKSCDVFAASANQSVSQVENAFLQLQYDEGFQQIMQATEYSQIVAAADDYSTALSIKANIPYLKDVALSTGLINASSVYLPNELHAMNADMPKGWDVVSLGIVMPFSARSQRSYLCFGYNYYIHREMLGNIYLTLDIQALISDIPIASQDCAYYVLKDGNGNLCFLLAPRQDQETLEDIREFLLETDAGTATDRAGRGDLFQKYVCHAAELDSIDCTLYGIVDTRAVNTSLDSIYRFTLAMLILLVVISTLGNAFFRRNLLVPLDCFDHHITRLREMPDVLWQTPPPLAIRGCSELQNIERGFTALLESLSRLTVQIQQKNESLHQAELLRKDIEIKHLRNQINPHFLYNTLEMIRSDALAGKIDQVSSIIASLGRFYRYSIKGSSTVTLREELDYTRAYLTIQQKRFKDRIHVIYNISGEAYSARIPKIILQPLVENAIVHGMEKSAGNTCTLFIGAALKEEVLTLSVRDDGIGIEPERLKELQEQMMDSGAATDKIGMANVAARLRLQYDDSCRFTIQSTPGDGTCVTMLIPYLRS